MARDTHLHLAGVYIPRYCVKDLVIMDETQMHNKCEVSSARIFDREPELRTHVTAVSHADFPQIHVFEPVDEVFTKVQAFLNQPE